MRCEAASAGFYESPGWNAKYPRLRLVTVAELLARKKIQSLPQDQVNVTFKKAPKTKKPSGTEIEAF